MWPRTGNRRSRSCFHTDQQFAEHGFALRDYLSAHSLDSRHLGGLLVAMPSRYSVDEGSDRVLKHLTERADLTGAVCLQ